MKKYLLVILEMLSNLFKWRANISDPKKHWQEKYNKWGQELVRLEHERDKAKNAWKAVAVGCVSGNVTKLWAKYLSAAKAVGRHRAREPKSKNS